MRWSTVPAGEWASKARPSAVACAGSFAASEKSESGRLPSVFSTYDTRGPSSTPSRTSFFVTA